MNRKVAKDLGLAFFDHSERYLITELRALHYRASIKFPRTGGSASPAAGAITAGPARRPRLTERYVRWAVRVYMKSVLEVISGG